MSYEIIKKIKEWDTQDINVLRELIREASEAALDDPELRDGLSRLMSSLPSAPIPADVDTSSPVWAMDVHGNLLVGDNADDIMTLAEYREMRSYYKEMYGIG